MEQMKANVIFYKISIFSQISKKKQIQIINSIQGYNHCFPYLEIRHNITELLLKFARFRMKIMGKK